MKGPILQVVPGENQVRPTVLVSPPEGGWHTILALSITTALPASILEIDATLGALATAELEALCDAGIRILVDGASSGLGASQSFVVDVANPEQLVSMALSVSHAVSAATHLVELQWYVAGGTTEALIGFINEDLDGCFMRITETL